MKKRRKNTISGRSTKINWTGKTKSGKGRVTLSTVGKTSVKQSATPYKNSQGQRRILVITTTRKVIK